MSRRFFILLLLLSSVIAGEITTPPPGSAERKAILDALRPPLNKLAGSPVKFLHPEIKVADGWASVVSGFESEGKTELPEDFSLDYFGLAQRVKGKWLLRSWGLSGDISATLDARIKFPSAPDTLFPDWANKMAAEERAKSRASKSAKP